MPSIAKFGGTSLQDSKAMLRCVKIVRSSADIRLVVVSATAGTTDLLIELCAGNNIEENLHLLLQRHLEIAEDLNAGFEAIEKIHQLVQEAEKLANGMALLGEVSPSCKDQMLSIGEFLSSILFAEALQGEMVDIREVMRTNSDFGKAKPLIEIIQKEAQKLPLSSDQILVTQGFIGSNKEGKTTTLGRGGSDYSASILAEALNAEALYIWTDVPGVFTCDPDIVKKAKAIDLLSFAEAAELATFGAKVLHPSMLWPAMRANIPVFVGDSRNPEEGGTWIRRDANERPLVRAVTLRKNQVLVTVTSLEMLGNYGFLEKLFTTLAKYKMSVDLVTTSEVCVSLTLDSPEALNEEIIDELSCFAKVKIEKELALITLIGNRITTSNGLAKETFAQLDCNVRLICQGASNHNLCFLVQEKEAKNAIEKLHEYFLEKEGAYR